MSSRGSIARSAVTRNGHPGLLNYRHMLKHRPGRVGSVGPPLKSRSGNPHLTSTITTRNTAVLPLSDRSAHRDSRRL